MFSWVCFFPPSSVVSPLLQGQHKIPAKKSQEWKCCSSETILTDKSHWFGHQGIIYFNIISEICSHFKTPGSFGSLYRPLCKYPLDPSKGSSLTRSAFWALTATSYICKRWAKQVQLTWNRKQYRKIWLPSLVATREASVQLDLIIVDRVRYLLSNRKWN